MIRSKEHQVMMNDQKPGQTRTPPRTGFDARTIKAFLELRHLADRASEWAQATLKAAGLPNEPGFYSPDPDGCLIRACEDLTAEERADIVAQGGNPIVSWRGPHRVTAGLPWADSLPSALGRLGYAPGTSERDAAELLELLANVAYYIQEDNAKQAASAAFYAGMLWRARRGDDNAEVGRRVRSGGRRGADIISNHEAHFRWMSADKRLKEQGVISERERARRIAEHFGQPFDTVRGVIRSWRKKQARSGRAGESSR
jgi:hypothetical protein